MQLDSHQQEHRAAFRAFSDERIVPHADQWDREQELPRELFGELAERGYLAAFLPRELGGLGGDLVTFGLLNEEIGRGCSSVRSLLTVHGMVCRALARWGSDRQKETWLARLGAGQTLGAFALTEPEIGSDAKRLQTFAERREDHWNIRGTKKWITFGLVADLFLLFANSDRGPVALLVERESPGLEIRPITDLLGTRASMLAELQLRDCRVPLEAMVARPGFGFSAVALSALEVGRYSVAWGCVGILQACRQASLRYADRRHQFGVPLREHQLVRRMLTDMIVDARAARALCLEAGRALDSGSPDATKTVLAAKYFCSRAAVRAALDAVQVHGANGCGPEYSVSRYLRDAKIMEIIEGSNEMQQNMIAQTEYRSLDFEL